MIGVTFGLIATSNLVQGVWTASLPWLNLTGLGIVLALPATFLSLRHRVSPAALGALLMLFAACALGALQPALTNAASDKRVSVVISVLLITAAAALCMANERRLRWMFATIVGLASIVLIGQVVAPDPIFLATGRRTPEGINSIGAGRALGAALVICLGGAVVRRGHRRLVLLLGCAAFSAGIIAAGSRGPLLGVVVAAAVMLWMSPDVRGRTKTMICVLAAIATFVGYHLLLNYQSRIVDDSDSGRAALYGDAFRIAGEHPLGVGWGNYSRHARSTLAGLEQGDNLYAHNILLEFWIEAGWIGGILFMAFVLVVLHQAAALRGTATGRTINALALCVFVGAMLSSDVIGNRMMWVAFAVILGMAGNMTRDALPTTAHRIIAPRSIGRTGNSSWSR